MTDNDLIINNQEISFGVPLRVTRYDKTAEIGKMMQHISRSLGNQITTQVVQNRGDYDQDVDIVVRIKRAQS